MTAGTDIRVSVIVPAYNSARFIRAAVASALSQTMRDLEIIVVEDGSVEPVPWVVELDPARIRYHVKENGGPASARNTGARLARAELLAFLDADDLWEHDKLERQLAALAKNPRAAFAYGRLRVIDLHGVPTPFYPRPPYPSGDIAAALFLHNFVSNSSVVVRRQCFEEVGGMDESEHRAEDYDLWLRLAERYEAVYVHGVVGSYRTNDKGLSRDFAAMYEAELRVTERAIARNRRPEFRTLLRRRMGHWHYELGYDYLCSNQMTEARREFTRSVRAWPWDRKPWLGWVRSTLPQPSSPQTHNGERTS